MRALPIRHVVAALLATAALLTPATAAHATVKVASCLLSDDSRVDAWTPSATTGQPVQFGNHCGADAEVLVGSTDVTGAYGFWSTTPAPAPPLQAQPGRVVGYTVTAPPGTTIKTLRLLHTLVVANADWQIRAKANGTVIATCAGPTTADLCGDGTTEPLGNGWIIPAGTQTFDIAAYCVAATPCSYVAGTEPTFAAVFVGGEVELDDPVAPATTAPTPGGLVGGKLTREGTITIGATDQLGLRRIDLVENNLPIAAGGADGTCVDWSLRPCAEPSAGASAALTKTFSVSALGLSTGSHVLKTRATDAAGNVTNGAPVTITVDETLLAATKLTGGGNSKDTQRQLGWTVPPGMIAAAAKVELCPATASTNCKLLDAPIDGPFLFPSDLYPNVTVRVRLTGQGGGHVFSEPVSFVWDTAGPKQPKLTIVDDDGDDRVVEFTVDPIDTDLASYAVRICASPNNTCTPLPGGDLTGTGPTRVGLKITSQGSYRVDIVLADVAGNLSLPGQIVLSYQAPPIGLVRKDQPMSITPKLPAKLPKSSIVVKGTATAGSASKITVTIAGRNSRRKAVKVVKVAKLATNGAFAVRIALPKQLNRTQGLLITIAATPAKGWIATTVRKRVRG